MTRQRSAWLLLGNTLGASKNRAAATAALRALHPAYAISVLPSNEDADLTESDIDRALDALVNAEGDKLFWLCGVTETMNSRGEPGLRLAKTGPFPTTYSFPRIWYALEKASKSGQVLALLDACNVEVRRHKNLTAIAAAGQSKVTDSSHELGDEFTRAVSNILLESVRKGDPIIVAQLATRARHADSSESVFRSSARVALATSAIDWILHVGKARSLQAGGERRLNLPSGKALSAPELWGFVEDQYVKW